MLKYTLYTQIEGIISIMLGAAGCMLMWAAIIKILNIGDDIKCQDLTKEVL